MNGAENFRCVSTNWCGRPWAATDYPSQIDVKPWNGEALVELRRVAEDGRAIRFTCSRGGLRPLVQRIRRNARSVPFSPPTAAELGVELSVESLRAKPSTAKRNFVSRKIKLEMGVAMFGSRLCEQFQVPPDSCGVWIHFVVDPLNALRVVLDTLGAVGFAHRLEEVAVELGDGVIGEEAAHVG